MTPLRHDPALCPLLAGGRCDDYGDGYAAGKAKAHFELRSWELGEHAPTCGCDPCQTVRVVVRKILAMLPDQHIDDCADPCWCHEVGP